jgi:predicted RNA binding protein YcfA (HicA-like mRNA interferase family)
MGRLVRELESAGFLVTRTGSGHWKVQHPMGGESVIMAFSPKHTGFQKSMIRLRKIGYEPRK